MAVHRGCPNREEEKEHPEIEESYNGVADAARVSGERMRCVPVLPQPFRSTDIERIEQTKVFLQSAGARPWPQRACLHILVKANEKQDGIRNETCLATLKANKPLNTTP